MGALLPADGSLLRLHRHAILLLLFTGATAAAPLLPLPCTHSGSQHRPPVTSAFSCRRFGARLLLWGGTPGAVALTYIGVQHTIQLQARPAPGAPTLPLAALRHAQTSPEEAPRP